MAQFTMVLRGPSAAIFEEGTNLCIRSFPTSSGSVDIAYATRLIKRSPVVSIPGQLWVEVQGEGADLNGILAPFGNAGMAFLPLLSVSANAHVGDINVELAFDSTPDIEQRQYFQQYLPPERDILAPARPIDVPATQALLNAIKSNAERTRIGRAASQYRAALESWQLGQSIESIAHLWMALEALTPVERKVQMTQKGAADTSELAAMLDIEIKDLDSSIRRQFLLEGDEESYRKAKQVSDGFEHGFADYDQLWQLSKAVRQQVAQSVRKAILRLSGVDKKVIDKLSGPKYARPMGTNSLAQYLHGTLQGRGVNLAANGSKYPFVKWNPQVKKMALNPTGQYDAEWEHKLSPQLAEGIKFTPGKLEIMEKP